MSDKFEGTPGKWSYDINTGVTAENFCVLAKVGSYETGVYEDKSNGQLMATAPELLEALQELVQRVDIYVNCSSANEVIKKALGK